MNNIKNDDINKKDETNVEETNNEKAQAPFGMENNNVKSEENDNNCVNTSEDKKVEENENSNEEPQNPEEKIAELSKKVEELTDELARSRADQYNLQEEYNNYVRRTKNEIPTYKNAGIEAVINAMLTVFDDIDAAKKHGDLEKGPFASIVTKMETILKSSFDVERFAQVKDEFDPNMHEALLVTPNPTVTSEQIGEIIQSGWKISDRVIRAAKVVVFAPTE